MKRYSVCVYPYGSEFAAALEHTCLINGKYEITALVSPKGWGLTDLPVLMNRTCDKVYLTINSSLSEVKNEFDTVFVPDFSVSESFTIRVIDNVISTLSKLKKVIWRAKISAIQEERLMSCCVNAGCEIDMKPTQAWTNNELMIDDGDELFEFSTPIVAISGSWENTDKFKISLALREALLNRGYVVSQIGSRDYCELFGFYSFPSFMFDKHIDESERVILFNRFVKRIIEAEDPEIIIITIPGAANDYDVKFTNRFGILHYLAFKAISVDFHIFSVFYKHFTNDYLKLTSDSCKYKFDSPVDCFHMSNIFINVAASHEKSMAITNTVTRQMVDDALESNKETLDIPVMNICRADAVEDLADMILRKLSDDSIRIML